MARAIPWYPSIGRSCRSLHPRAEDGQPLQHRPDRRSSDAPLRGPRRSIRQRLGSRARRVWRSVKSGVRLVCACFPCWYLFRPNSRQDYRPEERQTGLFLEVIESPVPPACR